MTARLAVDVAVRTAGIQPGSSLRRRARALFYRLLELWPALYCAVLRRRVHTVNVAEPSTQLVIEGFPRSGNSFAREAILEANPGLRIASHVHRAAHVLHSLDLGLPTLVLVRDAEDAVRSALFLHAFNSPDHALKEYDRFYRELWPRRSEFVVATFEQIVSGLDEVIDRLNDCFGTALRRFEHTPQAEEAIFRHLEQAARDGEETNEYTVARPSAARTALAAETSFAFGSTNPRLRVECALETQRFRELAKTASRPGPRPKVPADRSSARGRGGPLEQACAPASTDQTRPRGMDQSVFRFTALCLALTAAVGLVDALTRPVLIGLLIVGPCAAVLTGRARATAVAGLWAICLAVVLGIPDRIWATSTHVTYIGVVALVASFSVAAAMLIERRPDATWLPAFAGERTPGGSAPGPSLSSASSASSADLAGSADSEFVVAAYQGLLERAPDPEGLRHSMEALRSGTGRAELLRAIFESPEGAGHLLYSPGLRDLAGEFWKARQELDPSIRPIYFLHVMKTGGTAVTQALTEMAASWPRLADLQVDHLVCLPRPFLDQAMLIAGHLPLEATDLLTSGGALCTIIREPVARTLSHYAHIKSHAATEAHRNLSLDEFVLSGDWDSLWRDYQARQLVHRIGLADAWKSYSPVERTDVSDTSPDHKFPLQSVFDTGPVGLAGPALLTTALARLDQVELVGVTDDIPALIARVAAFWQQPSPPRVRRLRVTDERPTTKELPAALLDVIRDGTRVDAALYRRASEVNAVT